MFSELFSVNKPIIAMLHLKGDSRQDVLDRCLREAEIYEDNGIDSVIVEDYFGSPEDVEAALKLLSGRTRMVIGVNVLDNWELSWRLAKEYGAGFIQVDSVAGHLPPSEDHAYGRMIDAFLNEGGIYVIGGVRFKYKEILSGNDTETDLRIGMKRCHAIAVTGTGTGIDSPTEKLMDFRRITGPDFPLVVAAGLTAESVAEKLAIGDGAIVGSTFKENRNASGEVYGPYVKEFMEQVYKLR